MEDLQNRKKSEERKHATSEEKNGKQEKGDVNNIPSQKIRNNSIELIKERESEARTDKGIKTVKLLKEDKKRRGQKGSQGENGKVGGSQLTQEEKEGRSVMKIGM